MDSVGSLMRLESLVPAPADPVRSYGDWKRFTSLSGFPPPDDYRMLISKYGAGSFAGWIFLIEPFNPTWPFMTVVQAKCEELRSAQRRAPTTYPAWPIWPDPGGFLPWATTDGGDHIGWRTLGRPSQWTTLFWDRSGKGSTEYPVGTVDFLVNVFENSTDHAAFHPAPEMV